MLRDNKTKSNVDCWLELWKLCIILGGPTVVRADRGTENITIERIQKSLRSVHKDTMAKNSFLYGKSSLNQVCSISKIKYYLPHFAARELFALNAIVSFIR